VCLLRGTFCPHSVFMCVCVDLRTNSDCHGPSFLYRLLRGTIGAKICRCTDSVPGQYMWDLWCTEWHWDRFFFEYFGVPLSVTIAAYCSSSKLRSYQKDETIETWNPSKKQCFFESRGAVD
jgi:hypothetical protein